MRTGDVIDLAADCLQYLEENRPALEEVLPVSEVFGPTIQGEGPAMGRACYFIRFGGCNLSCSWCDTPYATGQHGIPLATVPRLSLAEMVEPIPDGALVILTGGEPTIHLRRAGGQALLALLKVKRCEIHVETNGMLIPEGLASALIDHFTVSPKIGVTMLNEHHDPSLADWGRYAREGRAILKAVWDTDDADAFVARTIALGREHGFPKGTIWVMPEGATLEPLQARWATIAQAAADAGINASHRLHALAWGDAKGH